MYFHCRNVIHVVCPSRRGGFLLLLTLTQISNKFPFIQGIIVLSFFWPVQRVRNSSSACYNYNFYFYLYAKFDPSYFKFHNQWLGKLWYFRQLQVSLIHTTTKADSQLSILWKIMCQSQLLKSIVLNTSFYLLWLANAFCFSFNFMYRVCVFYYTNIFFVFQTFSPRGWHSHL